MTMLSTREIYDGLTFSNKPVPDPLVKFIIGGILSTIGFIWWIIRANMTMLSAREIYDGLTFTKPDTSFDVEVAKLSAEITFMDIQLKESHSTNVSMANSKLDLEEKLQSLDSQKLLLILSFDKLKINHLNRIAALKLENNQLKTCSENEAIAFQENIAKLEQMTKKIVAKKDETIKHQKEFIAEMQSELTEKDILMDLTAQRKKELDDKLQQTYGLGVKHLQEMGKLKGSYLQLQNLMKKEKNNHQKSLQKEITIRQGAENTLKTMRSEFIALKKQPTNYAELQKKKIIIGR